MRTTAGLLLIGVGAILAFAVTTNTSVFNLHTAGFVLIFIGLLGLFLRRSSYSWVTRRLVRRTKVLPGQRVEETTYPTYVVRNPGSQRVTAGLPAANGSNGDWRSDTAPVSPSNEVVEEDVYEEE